MAIEEKHIHEDYVGGSNNLNDIGILRLASMVSYTPKIRPICLPSTVGRVRMQDGDRLTVAGWGRTLDEISSPTKQKVLVPLWKYDKCRKIYLSAKIAVGPSQICAGGEDLVDSCNGDSGGPLMSFHKGVWVLQGIVSFGYRCGAKNWPAIYTNVSVYDSWIREKMRP
uniref:Serine protease easter-like n=1 Tax=Drosophila rhopaloa TaxID=1041015 RepID=A0A6P4EDR9_DRORH